MPDPKAVNTLFGRIAGRYDLANRLLSFGADTGWRRRLVDAVQAGAPRDVLDLATGSGDVAFALADRLGSSVRITGMDFCQPMLDQAVAKQDRRGQPGRIAFVPGDGLALPVADQSFDAVTISFGLRNMQDRARCLAEMRRALRPGGRVHVLEFSQPRAWFRPFYLAYLRWVLPTLAGWVTGDRAAYVYLNESIEAYPDHEAMAAEFVAAGFSGVEVRRMTFGIVALHSASRDR